MLTVATVQSGTFTFPSLYSFPPFFTRQLNARTWARQSAQWASLILSYASHFRLWSITLSDAQCSHELFHNKSIDRRLQLPMLREIIAYMVEQGSAAYDVSATAASKSKQAASSTTEGAIVWLYWKRPEEWATTIYDWVQSTGQTNSILTFFELTQGDMAHTTEFHELPEPILRKAMDVLAKQGKAQVFQGVGEEGDGVKFV